MRSFAVAAALTLLLSAAPVFGQSQTPAGGAQTPAPTSSSQPAPPRPFPEGARIAVVNIQRVAAESQEGKASTAKVQALHQQKTQQLNEMNKKLQAEQQKLQQSALVMNEQARAQLEREIERQQKEIQRFSQDAQDEVTNLQQDLQEAFHRRLMPILQKIAQERQLHLLLSLQDAGIVWWDTGLDITAEVVKQMDATAPSTTTSSTSKPAAAPATPAKPEQK
ncbi:MAG TPA: OmpH family outer membrane protein [Vicinamibacterales bacterium]|nr:OmpH family outer membrane protein [Vicinamibacterales bacterium]